MKSKLFRFVGLSFSVYAAVLVTMLVTPPSAVGSGFAIFFQGAKETSMLESVIAHSEGPASNYYNPALLAELEGTQIEAGTTICFLKRKFESAQTGQAWDTGTMVFFPSALFATHQLNDKFTVGLGVVNPFGLGSDWGKQWEGRYIVTNAELTTFDINPNIAWKVTDKLSIGAGFDFLLLDATLEKNLNFSTYGLADGEQKFEGDGDDFGYNIGLAYQLAKDWSFGASYRSGFKVDAEGDAEHRLPPGTPGALAANLPNTGGSARLDLPPFFMASLCYKGLEKITIEAGIRWEGWSSYENLAFEFDQPIAGSRTSVIRKNWKDVTSYNIGIKYEISDTFSVRAGYRFEENPIPDDTFDPSVPEADRHDLTIGCKKAFDSWEISTTAMYGIYESRTKNNQVGATVGGTANGEYDTTAYGFVVSAGYKF